VASIDKNLGRAGQSGFRRRPSMKSWLATMTKLGGGGGEHPALMYCLAGRSEEMPYMWRKKGANTIERGEEKLLLEHRMPDPGLDGDK